MTDAPAAELDVAKATKAELETEYARLIDVVIEREIDGIMPLPSVSKAKKADLVEGIEAMRAALDTVEPEEEPVEGEVVSEEIEDEVGKALALREQAVTPTHALPSAAEFNASMTIANQIAGTTFVPEAYRNRPADVLAAILFGREIGLGPMTALRDIYMIDGRPALAAHRQLAGLRRGGVVILESESTKERAYIKARRSDTGEVMTVEFTYEEAQLIRQRGKPLVEKDNWRNYPADMLWARTVGRLTRRLGSDLLGGLPPYVAEEAADFSEWGVEYGAQGELHVAPKAEPRQADPTRYPIPQTWADIEQAVRRCDNGDEAWAYFKEFIVAASVHLYGEPDSAKLSSDERFDVSRKAAHAAVALHKEGGAETVGEFAYHTPEMIEKAWASVLDGHELGIPELPESESALDEAALAAAADDEHAMDSALGPGPYGE